MTARRPARLPARLLARAVMATRGVDTAYRLFDRARSRAVVRWASEVVLDEFNTLAYERDDTYDPGSSAFRSSLFPWEAAAIRQHFDPPPGRILLGGAGGGREAFALADRGYEVVAFEPAIHLAAAMADRAMATPSVQVFRARYEDLPRLAAARPGGRGADVRDLGPFVAAIMGWGSFSHLTNRAARIAALASLGDATTGPILVSFLSFADGRRGGRPGTRDAAGDNFSIFIGYFHTVDAPELEELAHASRLEVVALNTDETESPWPHTILRRAG